MCKTSSPAVTTSTPTTYSHAQPQFCRLHQQKQHSNKPGTVTNLAIPPHPSLQQKPPQPDIRTMTPRKHPAPLRQKLIQPPRRHSRTTAHHPLTHLAFPSDRPNPSLKVDHVQQDRVIPNRPTGPAVAPAADGNSLVFLPSKINTRHNVRDSQRLAIGVWVTGVLPGDGKGR